MRAPISSALSRWRPATNPTIQLHIPAPSLRKKNVSRSVTISPVSASPSRTAPLVTPWVTPLLFSRTCFRASSTRSLTSCGAQVEGLVGEHARRLPHAVLDAAAESLTCPPIDGAIGRPDAREDGDRAEHRQRGGERRRTARGRQPPPRRQQQRGQQQGDDDRQHDDAQVAERVDQRDHRDGHDEQACGPVRRAAQPRGAARSGCGVWSTAMSVGVGCPASACTTPTRHPPQRTTRGWRLWSPPAMSRAVMCGHTVCAT